MSKKHTPGPWRADGKRVVAKSGGLVATAGGDFYDDGRKDKRGWSFEQPLNTEANAALIAAAPALAEALVEAVALVEHHAPQFGGIAAKWRDVLEDAGVKPYR